MKVRCIKILNAEGKPTEDQYWVKLGHVYPVLAIVVGRDRPRFRLIGEDQYTAALFRPEMFEIVSLIIPPTWVIASIGPGSFELAPEPWIRKGFWERFFDRDPDAVACFERERAKILAADP